jgi:hypothetical protein
MTDTPRRARHRHLSGTTPDLRRRLAGFGARTVPRELETRFARRTDGLTLPTASVCKARQAGRSHSRRRLPPVERSLQRRAPPDALARSCARYRPTGGVRIRTCDGPAMAETNRRPATVTRFSFVAHAAGIERLLHRGSCEPKENPRGDVDGSSWRPRLRACGSLRLFRRDARLGRCSLHPGRPPWTNPIVRRAPTVAIP